MLARSVCRVGQRLWPKKRFVAIPILLKQSISVLVQGSGDEFKLGTGIQNDNETLVASAKSFGLLDASSNGGLSVGTGVDHTSFLIPIIDNESNHLVSTQRVFSCGSNYFCQTGSTLNEDETAIPMEVPISIKDITNGGEPTVTDSSIEIIKLVSGDYINFILTKRTLNKDVDDQELFDISLNGKDVMEIFTWGSGTLGNGTIFNIINPQRIQFSREKTEKTNKSNENEDEDEDDFIELGGVRDISVSGDTSCSLVYDHLEHSNYLYAWGCFSVDYNVKNRKQIENPSNEDIDNIDLGNMVRIVAPAPLFKIPDNVLIRPEDNKSLENINSNQIKIISGRGIVGMLYLKPKDKSFGNDIGLSMELQTFGRYRSIMKPSTPYHGYPESVFEIENCVVPTSFYTEDEEIISSLNVNYTYSSIEKALLDSSETINLNLSSLDLGNLGGDESKVELVEAKFLSSTNKISGILSLRNSADPKNLQLFLFEQNQRSIINISEQIEKDIKSILEKESIDSKFERFLSFDCNNGDVVITYLSSSKNNENQICLLNIKSSKLSKLNSLTYYDILENHNQLNPLISKKTPDNQSVLKSLFKYMVPKPESEIDESKKVESHFKYLMNSSAEDINSHLTNGDNSNILIKNLGIWPNKNIVNEAVNQFEEITILGEKRNINNLEIIHKDDVKAEVSKVWDHCVIVTNVDKSTKYITNN